MRAPGVSRAVSANPPSEEVERVRSRIIAAALGVASIVATVVPAASAGATASPAQVKKIAWEAIGNGICASIAPNALMETMIAGQTLHAKQFIIPSACFQRSTKATLELVMQADGNLVLYELPLGYSSPLARVKEWATGTQGNRGAWAVMQGDGNFVVYSSTGTPLWNTGTNGCHGEGFGEVLALQDPSLSTYLPPGLWVTGGSGTGCTKQLFSAS